MVFFTIKKSIGPIVATSLLIVIAVVALVGFQNWYAGYQSTINTKVESGSSNQVMGTGIETMIGSTIFIKNGYDNLTIETVKVDGKECSGFVSSIGSGMQRLNISGCINVSTNAPEVVVVTNKGIMSKYVFLRDTNVSYTSVSTSNGVFLDNIVEGLTYNTSTQNGITNQNGDFNYLNGEMISFYVSDIYLGTTLAKPIITPADLGGGINNKYTINLARFLQSSDSDGDLSNGINISKDVLNKSIGQTINFSLSIAEFETEINSIVTLSVNEKDARDHLVNSIAEFDPNMSYAFHFDDILGANFNEFVSSNILIPQKYEGPLSVSIIGDGSPELSINGGSWVANDYINLGDILQIRLSSANDYGMLRQAILILGDYSTIWSVTTKSLSSSLLCNTDLDGNGFISYLCGNYPMIITTLEGHLDPDDSVNSIRPNVNCVFRDGKSGCVNNFVVNGCGTGTVLDTASGLCWQQDFGAAGQRNWGNAKSYCNGLNLGGKTDWYLPSYNELYTIVDTSRASYPFIVGGNNNKFKNARNNWYWTKTTYSYSTSNAQYIGLHTASSGNYDKTGNAYVACVRRN